MKIKNLHVKNFRAVSELNLDFRGPDGNILDMVVLAGPNGCGKTSILEACLTLLGKKTLAQPQKTAAMNFPEGDHDFLLSCTIEQNGKEHALRISKEASPSKIPDELEHIPVDYFSSWRYPKLVGPVSVTVGKKGKRPSDNEENRLWLLKQYFVNLTASKAFESGQLSLFEEETAYERLNRSWKYFYPDRDEHFRPRRVGEDITEGFDIFLEGRAKAPIPLDALSSGEIEVLAFIGQTIRNPSAQGIIFIDEPELHLHASWHRAILRTLRDLMRGKQIICATHSPEVLDSAFSYERFTLLPENDPRILMDHSAAFQSETYQEMEA